MCSNQRAHADDLLLLKASATVVNRLLEEGNPGELTASIPMSADSTCSAPAHEPQLQHTAEETEDERDRVAASSSSSSAVGL